MPTQHFCLMPDAPDGKIVCVCTTGRDHGPDQMDQPAALTDAVAEPTDRFVGMADVPAEDVIE